MHANPSTSCGPERPSDTDGCDAVDELIVVCDDVEASEEEGWAFVHVGAAAVVQAAAPRPSRSRRRSPALGAVAGVAADRR